MTGNLFTSSNLSWAITVLYGLIALTIVLIYSRRQDNTSAATDVMEAIGGTDRRTFFSGRYSSADGARKKVRGMVREYVLGMFGSTLLSLLRCLAAAIALLALAAAARALHSVANGGIIDFRELAEDSLRLFAAALDSVMFNLSVALGYEQNLLSGSRSLNVISFAYLLGTTLTLATGVFAFLNNTLTTIVSILFPWSLFRAADPAIEIQDNSLWERTIHFVLDFPEIEWKDE